MKYVVWQVFGLDEPARFYVINQFASTNKIQSTWKNYLEAQATCDKLNKVYMKDLEKEIA